jgi:mannose-6-phosphate isomerase
MALYPTIFEPLFKQRVWGGRSLERLYGKRLPPAVNIGESWEISDRDDDQSVIANGPFAGRTLGWLMSEHGADVLGSSTPAPGNRFPLLCKILDARERLSLQVHPRTGIDPSGEPKTEMWYIAAAEAGAELFVGLRRGTTKKSFEEAIRDRRVAECFHRIDVRVGDVMFLPSGRVHGIGAGLVIFEIQQNSDTTYRVHDWDRVGADGKPRELHIDQSLANIDFDDVAPSLVAGETRDREAGSTRPLVRDPLFSADLVESIQRNDVHVEPGLARVIAVVRGRILVQGGGVDADLEPGGFCLLPASTPDARIVAEPDSAHLVVAAG